MRNCIEYVLKEQKIKDGLVYMTGPAPEVINWDTVYQAFLEEKKLWNKDNGRMYNHNIISFAPGEDISPEQALEFGKEFVEKWFPEHQSLISVHQDREHTHIHIVTNTVSYVDGMKLHNTKMDLQRMKDFTNEMCKEKGLTIAEKGKHFDGTEIDAGETIAWGKDKYHLLANDKKKSYVVDCAIVVMEVKETSCNREDFEKGMEERGWHMTWTDTKKHITFENDKGEKVRDSNLSKSFSMDISKEGLLNEFERQNEIRLAKLKSDRDRIERERAEADLERYYAEVEAAIQGDGTAGKTVGSIEANNRAEGQAVEGRENGGPEEDTTSFIRELRSKERTSEQKRDNRLSERMDREDERERLDREAERKLKRAVSRDHGFSR